VIWITGAALATMQPSWLTREFESYAIKGDPDRFWESGTLALQPDWALMNAHNQHRSPIKSINIQRLDSSVGKAVD